MNKHNLFKIKENGDLNFQIFKFSNWLIILFIVSCAQPSAPTGGNRDTTPPVVTKSNPTNYSTNFHQKEIKIEFDEWILPITNAKNQVIISPNIDPFPKIEAARNELTIKLKDTLESNTTYSIFFGDNLKDNNEGNALTNFKYVFSTGSYIDSLQVKGTLKTNLDKIPDNTYLVIYKEKEDSAFTTKRPFYISKIGNDGNFLVENVKEGDYRIYALSDKNSNYIYDLPTEAIAFSDSFYHIKSNLDSLNLEIFLPEDSILRIYAYDRTVNDGILHLTFNKEISYSKDEITVSVFKDSTILPIAFQKKDWNLAKDIGSEMSIYLPKLTKDTNNLTLIIKNNGKLIDSIKTRTETKNAKTPVLFFKDTLAYKNLMVYETQLLKVVSSNYSLSDIDTSRISITDTSKNKIPFTISRSEDLLTYFISTDWIVGMKYKMQFLDSTFSDLVGNYNKTQEFSILSQSIKKAGNLLITYQLPQKNHQYIANLKDNSGKVLDKQILRDSQTVKINYGLQNAGTFSVELIDDENKNGIWNSGNFAKKTLPEKIYKEQKPIVIKENWDAEETIIVDFSKLSILNNNIEIKNILNNTPNSDKFKKEDRKGLFGE